MLESGDKYIKKKLRLKTREKKFGDAEDIVTFEKPLKPPSPSPHRNL
jgi:hypothetical protein